MQVDASPFSLGATFFSRCQCYYLNFILVNSLLEFQAVCLV